MRADRYIRHGFTLAAIAALLAMTAYASAAAAGSAGLQRASLQGASGPAATPGWRVVKTFGPSASSVSGLLTAASAKDAWSVWTAPGLTLVERWTGSAWQPVPLPAKLDGYVHSVTVISASSASNAWLFNGTAKALRWTGARWQSQALPSWLSPAGSAAFSPDDVWVFGKGDYAARYNGHSWAKIRLPEAAAGVSAVAPDDIWALGSAVSYVMRWNGTAWTKVGLPLLPLPAGATVSYSNITGVGPKDAWLFRSISYSSSAFPTTAMMHWNGRAWLTVASPADIVGSLAPDGSGGLWADGIDINPGGFWLFYHLVAGHWIQVTPPGVFTHAPEVLTSIPGTRSLWATGSAISASGNYGVLLKYGP